MEFCECGSLKIGGNCTNKKCPKHVKTHEPITIKQLSVIKGLFKRLERDYNEAELKNMNSDDAKRLIYDLEDELEEISTPKEDSGEFEFPEDSEDVEVQEKDA